MILLFCFCIHSTMACPANSIHQFTLRGHYGRAITCISADDKTQATEYASRFDCISFGLVSGDSENRHNFGNLFYRIQFISKSSKNIISSFKVSNNSQTVRQTDEYTNKYKMTLARPIAITSYPNVGVQHNTLDVFAEYLNFMRSTTTTIPLQMQLFARSYAVSQLHYTYQQ